MQVPKQLLQFQIQGRQRQRIEKIPLHSGIEQILLNQMKELRASEMSPEKMRA